MAIKTPRLLSRTYFRVTHSLASSAAAFERPADYRAFLTLLNDASAGRRVPILAYCVMPHEWDLVMGPSDPSAAKRVVQRVSRTRMLRAPHTPAKACATVYQGLTHTRPLDDAPSLIDACREIERKPLRAGFVARAQDWPWSSLSERLFTPARITLAPTPFLASRAWIDYVNTSNGPLDAIDEAVWLVRLAGRPRTLKGTLVNQTTRPRRHAASPAALSDATRSSA